MFQIIAVERMFKGTEIRLFISFMAVGEYKNDRVYRFLRRFTNKTNILFDTKYINL